MASEDTEITLGVGKLLGLFFLLAAICGIFFSIGYSLGKSSGREQALNDQPTPTTVSADTGSAISANKPAAAIAARTEAKPSSDGSDGEASSKTSNLTFYNAVKQNNNASQTAADAAKPSAAQKSEAPRVVEATTPANQATKADVAAAHAPAVISHTSPVTGPGTIVVQIAAVSREDDAVALAGALRKKSYNVFVVNNPVTNDKFYHVQVGPFSTVAEAEATKAKLVAEGYNPIIKK